MLLVESTRVETGHQCGSFCWSMQYRTAMAWQQSHLTSPSPTVIDGESRSLEASMSSLFNFSFFITQKMKTQLREGPVYGTLPILYVFLPAALRMKCGDGAHVCALASGPGGGHGGGRCSGRLLGHGDGAFTSDGFGNGTGRPFLPYLSA
jgi:hypothetical protein